MVALFMLVAAAFAACGLGLVGLGIVLAVEGTVAGGLIGAGCGVVIAYGAYLFGRAAIRIRYQLHAEPLTPVQTKARRSNVEHVLGYIAIIVIAELLLPVSTGVRVIAIIGALLLAPSLLVVDLEPPKRRKPGDPTE
jgi:hypothetical protein